MGNSTSQTAELSLLETKKIPALSYSAEWTLIGEKNSELYGEVKLFRNSKTQQKCALKSQFFQDQRAFNLNLQSIQGSSVFDVPSLVKILDVETIQENRLCTTFQKIFTTYEYFEKTLEEELRERSKKKNYYTEIEIFQLLDCVLSALIFLDFRGKELLQLCPSKILQNLPLYKLTDQSLMTGVSDYQRLIIGAVDINDWMIAPEVMTELGRRKLKLSIDYQKAEIFNLGMICIYMATLIHPKEFKIYDFDLFVVDQEQLDQYILEFRSMDNYSGNKQCLALDVFKDFITSLVKIDHQQRYNFKEVLEGLTVIQDPFSQQFRQQSLGDKNMRGSPKKKSALCTQQILPKASQNSPTRKNTQQNQNTPHSRLNYSEEKLNQLEQFQNQTPISQKNLSVTTQGNPLRMSSYSQQKQKQAQENSTENFTLVTQKSSKNIYNLNKVMNSTIRQQTNSVSKSQLIQDKRWK